jgi:TM2 domain-containing membrane protein YozV
MPRHGGYGHERYQIREQPQYREQPRPQYREEPRPQYREEPRPQYREQYEPAQQGQEWAPLPLYGQEMYTMTVAPKSPAVSVLLSVFIPGLGSMVNDNVGVGVAILIFNIIGWILAIVLIGIPLAIGTWIWGLVDAYQSAQRWNRAHGIIS